MRDNFIKAFRANHSGCRGECDCGRGFYSSDELSWDWDDGELDWLAKDDDSTEVDGDVTYLVFNHRQYVIDCNCWQEKADNFMNLINRHDAQIAKYLNTERERKIFEAERVQIVNILSKKDEEFDDDIPF